jgi:putative membrane protein
MMMWPWFNSGFGGFWGMWFMPIMMIAVWGLIIWGIVALVRGTVRGGWGHYGSSELPPDSAIEILKRRYAKGEISREEFEEKKKNLA